jgi:hypothetical protein
VNKKELKKELERTQELGWCLIPPYILGRDDLSDEEKIRYGKMVWECGFASPPELVNNKNTDNKD